jgi:hypothetical protein
VQTAEGMTADMKRPNPRGGTFNYFDLYRDKLAGLDMGFFGHEGRGIHSGDALDHTLGIGLYFVRGTLPEGHKAIFEYIARQI